MVSFSRTSASVVLTCSALKRSYRERLRSAAPGLRFVFLDIDRDAALAAIPQMLPSDAASRRQVLDAVRRVIEAAGAPSGERAARRAPPLEEARLLKANERALGLAS